MTAAPGILVERCDRIDSTQSAMRTRLRTLTTAVPPPTLLVAAEQESGIGRFARRWSSPRGGLWCTLAWPLLNDHAAALDGLGLRVGIACTGFVRGLAPEPARPRIKLKWPNDVVIDGKKVLGVLCEYVPAPANEPAAGRQGAAAGDASDPLTTPVAASGARPDRPAYLLIGIGLNANFPAAALPPELHVTATTLQSALNLTINLDAAALNLASHLSRGVSEHGLNPATLALARESLHGVGDRAQVSLPTGEKIDATLIGIGRDGHAVLEQHGSRWPAPSGIELHDEPRTQ